MLSKRAGGSVGRRPEEDRQQGCKESPLSRETGSSKAAVWEGREKKLKKYRKPSRRAWHINPLWETGGSPDIFLGG